MEERDGGRVCEIEGGENKMVLERGEEDEEERRRMGSGGSGGANSIHPFVLHTLVLPNSSFSST